MEIEKERERGERMEMRERKKGERERREIHDCVREIHRNEANREGERGGHPTLTFRLRA